MINKSVLFGAGLFSLTCFPIASLATTEPERQTTPSQSVAPPTAPTNPLTAPTTNAPVTPAENAPVTPTENAPPNSTENTSPTSTENAPVTPTTLIPATPTNPTAQTSTPATGALDCNYHIPPTTSSIDNTLVLQWGQQAVQQTFSFEPSALDSQLDMLKACYTDQGWQSFNDALVKSGNLNAIKKENLTVSSMVEGQATITSPQNNQWKVTVPIQVVYQNDKEKIVQELTINLTISRKISGDLGIMQIVAMPRHAAPNRAPANAAPQQPTALPAAAAPSAPASNTSTAPPPAGDNTAP